MTRFLSALALVALLSLSRCHGLDLPIDINFNIGFAVEVIPDRNDTSHLLGLGVVADKIYNSSDQSLTITGFITNYGDVPCYGIQMRFAVTSYIGAGASLGRAAVTPDVIPPRGSARFVVHISLDDPRPQYAKYAITASSPAVPAHSDAAPEAAWEYVSPEIVVPYP